MDDLLPGFTIESIDDLTVVSGEVDAHTAPSLEQHISTLTEAQPCNLDLSAVTFLDSSGLRVLIDAHQGRASTDHPLTIVRPSQAVVRLLEISGLVEHLNIDAD